LTSNNKPSGFDTVSTNKNVSQLFSTATDKRIGPGVVLKVMAGDKFKTTVYGWYLPGTNTTTYTGATNIVTALINAMSGGIAGAGSKGTLSELSNPTGVLNSPVTSFTTDPNRPYVSTRPKAYLNWVLLDEEQLKLVSGCYGAVQIPSITGTMQKQLMQANNGADISVTKNGYLYLYVSNESQGNVYFDDIRVEHTKGPIMEETHYYPFGLTMAGISSKAALGLENKYKYNGKELNNREFSDGSGLEAYDYGARIQDPQLGRWFSPDPSAAKYTSWSPYNYTYNNPIKYIDPTGRDGVAVIDEKKHKITVQMKFVFYGSKASGSIARAAGDEIVNQYNGAKGKVTIDGKTYKVKMQVSYTVVSESKAKGMAKDNTDARLNFVRVEQNNTAQGRSFFEIGGNSGFFNTSDNLGTSTTAPHEVGHGFGLMHSEPDQRGNGQPNIMAARGTLVDPEYQYDQKSAAGTPGGTINPAKRLVTQENITNMFNRVGFNKDGIGVIGGPLTNYIYDSNGNVIQKNEVTSITTSTHQ
jgi:RHS repeat-associated protein